MFAMQLNTVDAYAHFGLPRFGSLEQLLRHMEIHAISHAVAVFGPRVPDIATMIEATRRYPDRVRCIGIPFGETKDQRIEAVKLQLDAGALGIRLEPQEVEDNPEILDLIGERGRWVYGIGSCRSQRMAELILNWLAKYPQGRIAAPHFMYSDFSRTDPDRSGESIEQLMRHHRFYGIFVRNLGMCGSQYPHDEYKPWIEYSLELCGINHLMWGSEYPVLFWRNEKVPDAISLFREFLGSCSNDEFNRFAWGNAQEVFFSGPAPKSAEPALPDWIERQFQRNRNVPFFPKGLEIPVDMYSRILDSYMNSPEFEDGQSLADYILKQWKGK
jgi:hypothetical protein